MSAWTVGFYFAGYILVILGWILHNIFMFIFGLFWIFDSHMTIRYKQLDKIANKLEEIYERQRWY